MKKKIYVRDSSPETGRDIDWSQAARVVFPNLKPSPRPVSLTIPGITLQKIRRVANKQGVPYQSLINSWLAERAASEIKAA
ncbi:MAG: CopG family antitoxin [Verrucomicrobia bacterium]|nr:CopG family antitoxin [Verrucomicrobiota bacterium]